MRKVKTTPILAEGTDETKLTKTQLRVKILGLVQQYKVIDEQLDSPYCDSTHKMKELYGKLGRIKRTLYQYINELGE